MATLWVDNDMLLTLQGKGRLEDASDNPITGATVEATLYESGGQTEVSGVVWPITLSAGSKDGEYSGTLPASAEVTAGSHYTLEITAEAPGGARAKWWQTVQAEHRT